jgi:transposase
MYIRRTKIKSGSQGEPYYTYRLVESVRIGKTVKQRTVINLGKYFTIAPEYWSVFTARIEQLLNAQTGQVALFDLTAEINERLEVRAQRYAALIIKKQAQPLEMSVIGKAKSGAIKTDFQTVDLHRIDLLEPRTIGTETLVYQAMEQLQLGQKLSELGFNRLELNAAIGNIIGRAVHPGSERETHRWLQENSALGELIDHDFGTTSLTRLYTIADKLLVHQSSIETFLSHCEQDLFQLSRTIVLYDLTNTYFEGQALANPKAQFGRSKEKRSDCPLVTLGLALDSHGFPLHSRIFAGNASEPTTLEEMMVGLDHSSSDTLPTVILDAGIATQDNINWLTEKNYQYIVVSRQRHKEVPSLTDGAVVIKSEPDNQVIAKRVDCPETGEVKLYCHSTAREKTDAGISSRFSQRFELALSTLNDGLSKKSTVKKYDKIMERIGRLKEKNTRVASNYSITVIADENKEKALRIEWKQTSKASERDQQAGVYCLRTNIIDWNEARLWETYVMLTELEATFRSLKTDLGLRPVYHQKEHRVTAHLFISLLAYHLVHVIRYQLKKSDINFSWSSIRNLMSTQQRITVSMPAQSGEQIYLRATSCAESHQRRLYEALGFSADPIGKKKTVIDGTN